MGNLGKFDGYLICTDCDGTLTDSHRKISDENRDAIRYFQSEGGLFTVASGRYPHYIDEFADKFVPNTYIVSNNGTVLYDLKEDKAIISSHITEDVSEVLCYIYDNMPDIICGIVAGEMGESIKYIRADAHFPEKFKEYYGENVPISSTDELKKLVRDSKDDFTKMVFVEQDPEKSLPNAEKLITVFGDKYEIVLSWDTGIEFLPKGSGKGQMISKMKELLPNVHTTIGIGDYGNDISMFGYCDIAYAVENAPDWVKAKAKNITVSNDDNAIAKIIRDLEVNINAK